MFSAIPSTGLPSESKRVKPSNTLAKITPEVVSVAKAGWNAGGSSLIETFNSFNVSPSSPVLEEESPPKSHAAKTSVKPSKDRKSTRLNSSHVSISYAVFCLKKKKNNREHKTS